MVPVYQARPRRVSGGNPRRFRNPFFRFFGFRLFFAFSRETCRLFTGYTAILRLGFNPSDGGNGMRVLFVTVGILSAMQGCCHAQAQRPCPPGNWFARSFTTSCNDHAGHGYWRYWIKHHTRRRNPAGGTGGDCGRTDRTSLHAKRTPTQPESQRLKARG